MEWGFYAHRKINRLAVFTLPAELGEFYKRHIGFITDEAIAPDRRRYINHAEAPRHYIDLDSYGDSARLQLPLYWEQALSRYGEDTLTKHGIVPWHVFQMKNFLAAAFRDRNSDQILRLSADLGHYIADAHVPLHTTSNYNGQKTDQVGIHGFWESRIPELFSDEYDYFVGKASYIYKPQQRIWSEIWRANEVVDSLLTIEKNLSKRFPDSRKFSFESRGTQTVRVYSYQYAQSYHFQLKGMVELQMRRAIKTIGDFWYTCWVDGGQPDLSEILVEIEGDTIALPEDYHSEHESGDVIDY